MRFWRWTCAVSGPSNIALEAPKGGVPAHAGRDLALRLRLLFTLAARIIAQSVANGRPGECSQSSQGVNDRVAVTPPGPEPIGRSGRSHGRLSGPRSPRAA